MLIASDRNFDAPLMYGYAFSNADLVHGTRGLERFEASTGRKIQGGEDGCYCIVRRQGHNAIIETDFFGSKKVFYYWTSKFWAVSDSWAKLVDYLRKSGERIQPRHSTLAAMRPSSAMNAITTNHTAAEGVKMLPLQTSLRIGNEGVELMSGSVNSNFGLAPVSPGDYAKHLKNYLELWVSRFRSLIRTPGLDINLDLTGGADSRCNFALVIAAMRGLREEEVRSVPQFRCGGTESGKDLPVARRLAEAFGFEINRPSRRDRTQMKARELYELWRNVNLGVYHSIYMPNGGSHPYEISFGGGGAENYRPFYSRPERTGSGSDVGAVDKFVRGAQRRLLHEHLKGDYGRDLREFFDGLPVGMSETQQLIAHYRSFRSRIHVGRTPNYRVKFIPFSSVQLDRACAHLDDDKIRAGQVNYDIMSSIEPRLLDIEFDSEEKKMTPWIQERLTVVDIDDTVIEGSFWGNAPSETELPQNSQDTGSVFDYLIEDYEGARKDPFVTSFWPADVLREADEVLTYRAEYGRFTHATQAAPLSWLLVTRAVSPENV